MSEEKYQIAIASDHKGYELKREIIGYLERKNFSVDDFGVSQEGLNVDYPDYAAQVVESITTKKAKFGILICATGIGMSIAANREPKIRAALCHNIATAELSRAHNNANVLVLGSLFLVPERAIEVVEKFLFAEFEGDRHEVRIQKISAADN